MRQGDLSHDLFYVVSGSATLRYDTDAGRELVLGTLYPGEFFGEIGLFDEDAVSTTNVRAKSRCVIERVDHHHLRSDPTLLAQFLLLLAPQLEMRLRTIYRRISEVAFKDVGDRIKCVLHDLSNEPEAVAHPHGKMIVVSRKELASTVGASREMVGRVIQRLEQQCHIRTKGKSIVVHSARSAASAVNETSNSQRPAATAVVARRAVVSI